MHPHMLITLVGHDLMERMLGRLHRVAQKELVQELQRWSDAVLHAASRMRFDCQNFLAKVLEEEAGPLPLSEHQRKQAGTQYNDAPLMEVERDGHELRHRDDVDDAHPVCLTGCYSSLRPMYIRRLKVLPFVLFQNVFEFISVLCLALEYKIYHELAFDILMKLEHLKACH